MMNYGGLWLFVRIYMEFWCFQDLWLSFGDVNRQQDLTNEEFSNNFARVLPTFYSQKGHDRSVLVSIL